MNSQKLQTSYKLTARKLRQFRGLIFRGLLCWMIGWVMLANDEITSYDSRLQVRGPQIASTEIVLITLKPSDLTDLYRLKNRLGKIGDITDITDAYYWDPQLWQQLLSKLLLHNPKKIGVTLFFHQNLGPLQIPQGTQELFQDPRIVWGASPLSNERYSSPLLTNALASNIGSLELVRDEDGVVRRFVSRPGEIPHLVQRLNSIIPYITVQQEPISRFVNYRGGTGTFVEYSLKEILDDRLAPEALQNKYVLIGSESSSNVQNLTPLGASKRHEIMAQILDNMLEKRWIKRASVVAYAVGILVFLALAVALILAYPQSIALVLIFWLATFNLALSAWVFDSFYIWLPAFSTSVMLAATWVVFIGYQAHQMERKNWQLQKDQEYLADLEQLKNNFVSLISHDLKTPIAKIQAIAERLLVEAPENNPLARDLNSLKVSAEELNKYVQSVLKVLRVESKNFQLTKEVGDINETIEQAKQQLSPLAQDKNIHIESQLEPLFSIEVDFTLIREVLINLIDNAIKYTPPGGTIKVSSREMNNKVWIEIDDNGAGIDPEDMDNIWGKFVRGKNQDLNTKGSGLGLYLVKYFIELHGGEVFLKSELKKGTKISFSLPLEENEKDWL